MVQVGANHFRSRPVLAIPQNGFKAPLVPRLVETAFDVTTSQTRFGMMTFPVVPNEGHLVRGMEGAVRAPLQVVTVFRFDVLLQCRVADRCEGTWWTGSARQYLPGVEPHMFDDGSLAVAVEVANGTGELLDLISWRGFLGILAWISEVVSVI